MTVELQADEWARNLFSKAELGDKRLTRRLIQVASQISSHTGKSLVKSCEGDEAKLEGTYRFIRNTRVDAESILASGFARTVEQSAASATILALEDSTTLGYRHQVSESLGDLGGQSGSPYKGFWVHSVLLLDAQSEQTLGLVEQEYWTRDPQKRGAAKERRKRAYADKESFKWERASQRVAERLGSQMSKVISICDREADIYNYLAYKCRKSQRFIVRAGQNRSLQDEQGLLFEQAKQAQVLGHYEIHIPQKGGRKGRKACLELRAGSVTLKAPQNGSSGHALELNLVVAEEVGESEQQPLRWLLLTSEPVNDFDDARQISRYYELRWRVEDFHKAWKSGGTLVEGLRLQKADNIKRIAVIMAFVAVRLLQMREVFHKVQKKTLANIPCDNVLEEMEWKVLWVTDKQGALPKEPPPLNWAYLAIARLGGWIDTKRSGAVGWAVLWDGWYRLQDRLDGVLIAQSLLRTDS